VTAVWIAALVEGLSLLRHNPYRPISNLAFVLFMLVILSLICYWKGEPQK